MTTPTTHSRTRSAILVALVTLAFVVVSVGLAFAEDGDETDPDDRNLDEIKVTAKRVNESTDDPPVFVETIDMREYEGRFVTTPEVLARAVGVNVRDFGGLGRLSTVSIRGASAEQVVILVDGVHVNPASGGGVDLSSIPPAHIDRIEVIRGGDSAFFGDAAIGGVVNIVTKRAKDQATNTGSISYGSFNTLQTSAARSQGFERASYMASVTYFHSDGDFGFRNNNGTEFNGEDDFDDIRKNNEADNRGALVKANFSPGSHVEIGAQNEFYSSERGVPGLVTFPSPNVHEAELRNTATLTLAIADLPASRMSWRTRVSYPYREDTYKDPRGEQTGVPRRTEQATHSPDVEQTIQYVWGEHQIWTASGQYRRDDLRDDDFDNPTRDTVSGAIRDQISLAKDIVTLVPAVRYDDISDTGDAWSPKFGAAVKPLDWMTLKANAGRSFRAPSFAELYYNHGFVEGNVDLEPERATSYDAGAQLHTSWLFVEGAAFRSDIEDLIEYVLVSGFRYKPYNIGRARLDGVELALTLEPVRFASLSGSYTLLRARDLERDGEANAQIPGRPRHTGFARAEGHWDVFTPFVEFHYIGGNFVTAANTKLLPERKIWNVGLTTRAGDYVTLGMEAKNVGNDEAVDVRGFPLPGRSVFMTVSVDF